MAHEYRRTRRVEFAETDAAGIVHFANYHRYMEETEHEFIRSIGLSVHPMGPEAMLGAGPVGFPRISAFCEYLRPLRFEDEVEIVLRVARKGESTIVYHFLMEVGGKLAARGEFVVVSCRVMAGAGLERVPLPAEFATSLEEHPDGPLEFRRDREARSPR